MAMNMVNQVSEAKDVKTLGDMPKCGLAGSCGRLIASFVRGLHCFAEWLHHFVIPTPINEGFSYSISSPVPSVSWFQPL